MSARARVCTHTHTHTHTRAHVRGKETHVNEAPRIVRGKGTSLEFFPQKNDSFNPKVDFRHVHAVNSG